MKLIVTGDGREFRITIWWEIINFIMSLWLFYISQISHQVSIKLTTFIDWNIVTAFNFIQYTSFCQTLFNYLMTTMKLILFRSGIW